MSILFDDDATGRMAPACPLRQVGFEVDEAIENEEALRRFDPHRHALVITDLRMPGGGAVLQRVRAREPDVPALVFTPYGSVERAVTAVREGASDFLEGPFGRTRLELTVRRALELATLRTERVEVSPPEVPARPSEDAWLERLPEGSSLQEPESRVVAWTLERREGNLSEAARVLGGPQHVLIHRVQKCGLRGEGERP